jgi:hypothetical protein
MASNEQRRRIGEFEVTSKQIVVKDPCYDDTSGSTFPAKNGNWTAEVEFKGRTITSLTARVDGAREGTWVEVCEEVVDSGQMGIFNQAQSDNSVEADYDKICKMTLSDSRCGIIYTYGAVSATAYGDGSYPVLVIRDIKTGEVEAVKILFDSYPDDDYPDPDELAGTDDEEENKDDDAVH